MAAHPTFPAAELESVCRVLADTDNGLSGSEIGHLLTQQGIADPAPDLTKWKRLSLALGQQQQRDGCGTRVVSFILEAMKPVRYVGKTEIFEARRVELNHVLIFTGLELGRDGQLRPREAAKTLTEADQRAGRLRAELLKRNVHPDVLRFCRSELLQENCFHAVLEATKSVADKIRTKTGLTGDGAELHELRKDALEYWTLSTDSPENKQRQIVLAQKIKGMIKSLSADSNYYCDRYCKFKSGELQSLLVEVADACTGGDFETVSKKVDTGRYILIVNAINRVKSEFHRRKL